MTDPRLHVGTSGWNYPDWVAPFYPTRTLPRDFLAYHSQHFGAAEIDSTSDRFYRLLEDHHTAVILADPVYMPKLDRVTTDFAYIQLPSKRSTMPDDFSRVRLDREPEFALWAVGVREYQECGFTVFVFANNHFQGHGLATARALLGKLAGVATQR